MGLSPVRAANLLLLLNVAFVLGAPLGGWLSDRVLASRKKVVAAALAGTALAELALAATSGTRSAALVGAVLAALGVAAAFLHGTGWLHDRWSGGGARSAGAYRAAFTGSALLLAAALALYSFTRAEPRREGARG